MSHFSSPRRALGVALSTMALLVASTGTSSAAVSWAPADTATIHPGIQTYTGGAQCTANFVFTSGASVYIGQAAHCSGTGAATETNGCLAESLPVGTPVDIGGTANGVMVYNSWLAMQAAGETDPDICNYNDFALVQVDGADIASVNPSIPFWGGPVATNTSGTSAGQTVYSFGNSGLRLGLEPLSPKVGISLGTQGGGWSHPVYTASPGIPGDSGSAFLDSNGNALGVTSTLALLPIPASNNISDISRMLGYMASHGGPSVSLEPGTEPFQPLPLAVPVTAPTLF